MPLAQRVNVGGCAASSTLHSASAGGRIRAGLLCTLAFALLLPWAEFWVQHDIGLHLADEGFVWYGAQRVLALDIPQRDFQSYDIGRYYWYAAWMWLTHSIGIFPVRLGSAVLASACMGWGALLIRGRRGPPPWPVMALGLVTLLLWMVPDYKLADATAVVLLAYGLAGYHRDASPAAGFRFGVCLGVASVIGINHALYGTLGALLSLAVAWRQHGRRPRRAVLAAALAGCLVGYAPALGFHLFVPGFSAAFVDDIRRLVEAGATNLWVPLPRLDAVWSADGLKVGPAVRETFTALVCLAAPAFLLLCAVRLWRRQPQRAACDSMPAFIAAVSLSLPYLHYAWSRLDIVHLAVSALPLVLALYAWPAPRWSAQRVGGVAAVALASLVLALPEHPWFRALRSAPLETVVVHSETLRVQPITADNIRLLRRLVAEDLGGRPFYAAPFWPGAYALFGVRAPTWEIYPLFAAMPSRQRTEVRSLASAGIGFAVVNTFDIDDRLQVGLATTHPLIARYLDDCLLRVESAEASRQEVAVYIRSHMPGIERDPAGCAAP